MYLVIDAISQASRNVSILLNRKLEVPPVPLKTVRKNEDSNVPEVDTPIYRAVEPLNIIKVYEIWQVFLEKNKDDLDNVFIILSGEATLQGYRNAKWSNIKYEGFYTTIEEAQNEISGYLH